MASSIVLCFVKGGGGYRRILSSPQITGVSCHLWKTMQFTLTNQTTVGTTSVGSCIMKGSTVTVTSVRHNTQHRIVLLPEVPPDNSSTNPILKRFDEKPDLNADQSLESLTNLPDFGQVTE